MKRCLLSSFLFLYAHKIFATLGGDLPVADFSYYIEFVGSSAEVSFLNESTDADTYYWDFGDGGTSTDLHPFHAYPEPGIFIVCLTSTNDFGSDTYCDTLNTYYAPSADFAYSGDPLVMFTDLTTNYPTTWDWFFGDGETDNIQNPEHLYLENGDYNVCLSANNPGGTSYTCKTITISSYLTTVASFSYSGDPEVNFTDFSSEAPYAWSWDFGDGATSTEQNPTHIYIDNGTFNVCLTATNAGGTNTFCQDVEIIHAIAPPVAEFSYLIIDLEAAFVDESGGEPTEWFWDFDDGTTSEEQNPVHAFSESGSYNVCLTATNEGGDNTVCKEISLTTSIINIESLEVHVYPNPTNNILNIHLNESLQLAECFIYDGSGKIIQVTKNLTGKNLQVSFDKLEAGKYYLLISDKNGRLVQKEFIIN